MIDMVRAKYGNENVAQVLTYINMQGKSILDSVGKVMDIKREDIDSMKKLLIDDKLIRDTILESNKVPIHLRKYIEYCSRLEGLPKSTSLHAGGLVICPQGHKMGEYSALTLSKKNDISVQCTKESVEQVGLVKYDILATRVLDIIGDTIRGIGKSFYEFDFDYEDKNVWNYINKCETLATFQTESNFMTEILRKIHPENIEDLCAVISLGRPDTAKEVDKFVLRKEGFEDSEYYDDMLIPVLQPTYGAIIYQETVMNIARIYANYSDGEADRLRKGLGKKKKEVVKREADEFSRRALEAAHPEETVQKLTDMIAEMGGYLFNKSHKQKLCDIYGDIGKANFQYAGNP